MPTQNVYTGITYFRGIKHCEPFSGTSSIPLNGMTIIGILMSKLNKEREREKKKGKSSVPLISNLLHLRKIKSCCGKLFRIDTYIIACNIQRQSKINIGCTLRHKIFAF